MKRELSTLEPLRDTHARTATPHAAERISADVRPARNRFLRTLYAALGMACVGLAIVGIVLPGWPTTIWLIVAAWLFSRSSRRFYAMVVNHRMFGPIVRDYRAGNGIPLRIKLIAIASIVLFAGVSAFFLIVNDSIRLVVVAVAMFGIGFLVALPVREPYALQPSVDVRHKP